MRLSRLRAVTAVVVPLVFLAACGSGNSAKSSADPLDAITVGGTQTAPTVTFKTKGAWPLGSADEDETTTAITLNVDGTCFHGNAKHVR